MIISGSTSVAANSTSTNVLAGNQFEFLPSRCVVGMRASAAATGLNTTMLVGGITVAVGANVSNSNRFPIIPDDNLMTFRGGKGERLYLTFTNTTGAAITVQYVLDIIPG